MLEKILIFILFLGPLVFFHELGHFFFARLFGVKVEVFSIGFGPKLLRWKWGDTEYALSLIPLGGYVKMFGDDPLSSDEMSDSEKKVAFTHKSKWARFWIVFGGPLANFILAFFIYLGLVSFGEKVPQARFGNLKTSSSLYQDGFRSGDALKRINGKQVLSFDDLNLIDSQVNSVSVGRGDQELTISVDYTGIQFIEEFSKAQQHLRAPVVANASGEMFLVSVDSSGEIDYDKSYEALVGESFERKITLHKITSDPAKSTNLRDLKLETNRYVLQGKGIVGEALEERGFFPADLVVSSLVMGSPADKAGVKKDDLVLGLEDRKLTSFEDLRQHLQVSAAKGASVSVTILRDGKEMALSLIPELKEVAGQKVYTIGVYSSMIPMPIKMIEARAQGIGEALTLAINRTKEGLHKTVLGFKKLITAEVPLDSIGGPLAIGQVASESYNISLSMFFRLMALISINLGIINLFPIPVLDGGHIVFIFLEILNRGPLSVKKIQIAQQFGMSLLFLLIFVALFNDIARIL